MNFNIVNIETTEFPVSVGISEERQQELTQLLDAMVKKWTGDTLRWITTATIAHHVAAFCHSLEEFAYCWTLHMGWHQRRGMQLSTGPIQRAPMAGKATLMIVLDLPAIRRLHNYETLTMNAKDVGLPFDLPISIIPGRLDDEDICKRSPTPFGVVYRFPDQ